MELIPPNTKINFLGNRHYAYAFTTVAMVISLLSIPIKGHIVLGIDFTGGVMTQVRFKQPVHVDEIRATLAPIGRNIIVQKLAGAAGGEDYVIRLEPPEEGIEQLHKRLDELLSSKFGKDNVEVRGFDVVGPKVGKDLRDSAIWATVIALLLLLIYMAFRFTFTMGLGAVVCLIHDLTIIYGVFVWTGKEFNLTILAAALTVVGYDINDTIVVCDRIRENLRSMKKQPLMDVFNLSINQTLSRTILTSGFTSLVVIAMLVSGNVVLQDFAWALMVGIIFGTYSSIFVAAPLVLELDRLLPVKRG